jgi:predicted enzyme related to lactoylglutathione lyase
MVPRSGDDAGHPSWTVDFWIADVDDAVSKLSDAGGEVLAAPSEVTGTGLRQAVVRDPQGAILTLTQPPGAP